MASLAKMNSQSGAQGTATILTPVRSRTSSDEVEYRDAPNRVSVRSHTMDPEKKVPMRAYVRVPVTSPKAKDERENNCERDAVAVLSSTHRTVVVPETGLDHGETMRGVALTTHDPEENSGYDADASTLEVVPDASETPNRIGKTPTTTPERTAVESRASILEKSTAVNVDGSAYSPRPSEPSVATVHDTGPVGLTITNHQTGRRLTPGSRG